MKELIIDLTKEEIEKRMTNIANEIIEDLNLNYGNACVESYKEGLMIVFEAPNNTTLIADLRGKTPTLEKLNRDFKAEGLESEITIIGDDFDNVINRCLLEDIVRSEMIETIELFDAEDLFNEIWSESFGIHNGFSAFQFVGMLQEDAEFFEDVKSYL